MGPVDRLAPVHMPGGDRTLVPPERNCPANGGVFIS